MLTRRVGAVFEQFACEQLVKEGYKITDRNFTCHCGEIDIIALKENVITFVEVKARYAKGSFKPEEAMTKKKINHITHSAVEFLKYIKTQSIPIEEFDFCFDFISISYDEKYIREYKHYKNFCVVNSDDIRRLTL